MYYYFGYEFNANNSFISLSSVGHRIAQNMNVFLFQGDYYCFYYYYYSHKFCPLFEIRAQNKNLCLFSSYFYMGFTSYVFNT